MGLFPETGAAARESERKRRIKEYATRFRAAYPACKQRTHPERLEPALDKLLGPLLIQEGSASVPLAKRAAGTAALQEADALFKLMLGELEVHKASERWEDPAFIPHMASWVGGTYWEHDRAQYRPRARTKNDHCPECGQAWRVHNAHPSGPGQKPNAQGTYCS